jgi:hypothetical protein
MSGLQSFGPELWVAQGPVVAVAGFAYPTRMAIMRLSGGGLFVWSPVELTEALRSQVEALGPVRHIVAPNSLHHLALAGWKAASPEARLYAPPGLRRKRPDLEFDADLEGAPDAAWAEDIDQVMVRGNAITTEVVFFHRPSATVLFTDLIQQFPPGWFRGWRAVVARLDLMREREAATPRKFRLAFVDREQGRADLQRIQAWPAERVLMAHGEPVTAEGRAYIARAFRWLTG